MRFRLLKPGFFTDDDLCQCEPLARLLFAGLWCAADREGRLEERPSRLKAEILPFDDCDVSDLLRQLAERGFVIRYPGDGVTLLQVTNFARHQRISGTEAQTVSKYPAPPGHDAAKAEPKREAAPETSAPPPEVEPAQVDVAPTPSARVGVAARPLNVEEVVIHAAMIGMPEADARAWFADCAACGWTRGDGTPFAHWRRQMVLARDKLRGGSPDGGPLPVKCSTGNTPKPLNGQPSLLALRDIKVAKETLAKDLWDRFASETALEVHWSDPNKRHEYYKLRREVKELTSRIASWTA